MVADEVKPHHVAFDGKAMAGEGCAARLLAFGACLPEPSVAPLPA